MSHLYCQCQKHKHFGVSNVSFRRSTGCWIFSPDPLSPASSSSEALDEIELLDLWLLAVSWYDCSCDNPGTLSVPPSTELMSSHDTLASSLSVSTISSDIVLGSSNHSLLLVRLILCQHSTLTIKCWIGRCKLSMQHNTVDVNSARSLRNEM